MLVFNSVTVSCFADGKTKEQREHDELMRQADARRHYHAATHFTVVDLMRRLSKLDPSLPVCLYDMEYDSFYESEPVITERNDEFAADEACIGKHVVIGWKP